MSQVIDFPGRPRLASADEQRRRERDHDALLVQDVLKAALPAEALRHASGEVLLLAANAALAAVDEARRRRRFAPNYDEHRAGGELAALDWLWLGDDPPPAGGAA